MKIIETDNYKVEIGGLAESSFEKLLVDKYSESKKVIIVDENTKQSCLGYLLDYFECLQGAEVILLPAGEETKQMSIVFEVWEAMTDYGIGRSDLIINLGGGVITDAGGFIASCYKRGCDFINIPTSLLAMVDASIGGKTGINLGKYKNQIGVFSNPKVVYIDHVFLESLPESEMKSGYAEMIKHALLTGDKEFSNIMDHLKNAEKINDDMLMISIKVKHKIVQLDPMESGVRKLLNFGHTFGHAIEGEMMGMNHLSHGHAIAIGMVMESYLSMKMGVLKLNDYNKIEASILKHFEIPQFSDQEISAMIELMDNDKKNKNGLILCCFLKKIGDCSYDNLVDKQSFLDVFLHFKNKQINPN